MVVTALLLLFMVMFISMIPLLYKNYCMTQDLYTTLYLFRNAPNNYTPFHFNYRSFLLHDLIIFWFKCKNYYLTFIVFVFVFFSIRALYFKYCDVCFIFFEWKINIIFGYGVCLVMYVYWSQKGEGKDPWDRRKHMACISSILHVVSV